MYLDEELTSPNLPNGITRSILWATWLTILVTKGAAFRPVDTVLSELSACIAASAYSGATNGNTFRPAGRARYCTLLSHCLASSPTYGNAFIPSMNDL